MEVQLTHRHRWIFCIAAMGVWLALGWPVLDNFLTGGTIRNAAVPALWFVPFSLFGAAVLGAMALQPRPGILWVLIGVEVAAVIAMTMAVSWAGMTTFLIIPAWQIAIRSGPVRAIGLVGLQTLAVVAALAQALNPDLCWVIGKSFALELFVVFAAQALRREAVASRALAQTNRELRSAQAIIANSVRNAERLRISRELHDAWGHELTALGLQLEIASQTDSSRSREHVMQAKSLSKALLAKVRDVVAALREAERCDLRESLNALAGTVPVPAVHVDIASDVEVRSDQAHALIRCAQEAVTNAVRHSHAANLWLQITAEGNGVRLVASNDGDCPAAYSPGSGLVGMRERLEALGGRLAVRSESDRGFILDAWLPRASPQPA